MEPDEPVLAGEGNPPTPIDAETTDSESRLYLTEETVPPRRLDGERFDLTECNERRLGLLILRFIVSEDGRVQEVIFLRNQPSLCVDETIRRALSTWRYEPATLDGEPIAVYLHLTIHGHPQ